MISLEVCANSAVSAIAAQMGGAFRVELCNNLQQGGITPSHGHIVLARRELQIKLFILIRPRSGDFLYTKNEFNLMLTDIQHCIELGCDGIVTGILNTDGTVDMNRNEQIVNLAHRNGLGTTFHRAFDVCANQEKALEDIIELGFERVLTSGGKSTAMEGASVIRRLVNQAAGRIIIMPGSGINEGNIADIIRFTNVTELHSSASVTINSEMRHRNEYIIMGGQYNDEYATTETDAEKVKRLIKCANSLVLGY